jgi:hypothetical protein
MAENPSCYRALLAKYLSSFSDSAARWYPILFDGPGSLSSFLGLDNNLRYIPLLLKCGLIKEIKMQGGGGNIASVDYECRSTEMLQLGFLFK